MHPTDLGDYFILFYGTLIYVGLGIVSFFSTILLLMQINLRGNNGRRPTNQNAWRSRATHIESKKFAL